MRSLALQQASKDSELQVMRSLFLFSRLRAQIQRGVFKMPMIESYSFGRMVIDGIRYNKDVIIFPDSRILSPWWRNQGHVLTTDDLRELIATAPEVVVCGTGAMGVMRPTPELQENLAARNIEFIAQKSVKAIETYNNLSGTKRVGGCFHLSC
jgi:hypothetical protein